ncbi:MULTISPECIES: hypothetical protein [Kosakonia]|uniref:hypothetical protein n=1 Tax=Kosakonia TaxID=1330547 RepID=UPI0005EF2609|nr:MULTISPECIES: hypothetical protein [Kosakonia]RCX01900.1 hypothetical protein DFO56_104626 [Kosakonia sp. AG348]
MVAAQVKFIVVGHHSRYDRAYRLARMLEATIMLDEGHHGANWNHRRALEWAANQACRVVVIEDDAVPTDHLLSGAMWWVEQHPDSLISFYLGTGRPPQYQAQIAERLIAADRTRADYITLPQLIHGVCYSVPPQHLPRVLARWDSKKPADFALGDAWGAPVVYPCWSLVDHADGEPVEQHPDQIPRTERRRAWRLHG